MAQPVKLRAVIGRVVRINGKAEAAMTVIIPISAAVEVPLGECMLTIQEVQPALFDKKQMIKGAKSKDEDEE